MIALILWLAVTFVPSWPRVRITGFGLLIGLGFLAAAILALPGGDRTAARSDVVAQESVAEEPAACVRSRLDPPTFAGGGHPGGRFVPPGRVVAEEDVIHVITDGYAVVHYEETLPAAERQELAQWVDGATSVIAVPASGQEEPVRVQTAYRQLSCTGLDLDAIEAFTAEWVADVKARQAAN